MFINILSLICLTFVHFKNVVAFDIQFDRIELLNALFHENRYNISVLRVAKFNRTGYGINMDAEFFNDINDEHFLEVRFYYNRFV